MLLRVPYGENTNEIHAFEEITTAGNKTDLLWGNPSFACTQLIFPAFTEHDWQMPENSILEIGEMTAYSGLYDGESRVMPGAETLITASAIDDFTADGQTPLVNFNNTNNGRLPHLQPVSSSEVPLRGPWHKLIIHL